MRLMKFSKWIFFITILSLVYIHLQMKIFTLAYQRTAKEKQIRRLIEQNGHLTHEILKLKSANNIGTKLLSDKSGMQFVDQSHVLRIKASKEYQGEFESLKEKEISRKSNSLLSFLPFKN